MIKETLKNLGLNEKEIAIYLALLPIGSATASILGRRAKMPRSTAKYTCEQLMKKRIIQATVKKNYSIYSAEPPLVIKNMLEIQRQEIEKKEDDFNRILNELTLQYNPNGLLPQVKFYTDLHEVMDLLNEVIESLSKGEELLSFVNVLTRKEATPKVDKMVNGFLKNRLAKNISTRVIAADSEEAQDLKKLDHKYLRQTKIVNLPTLKFPGGEIFILKDKIFTISLEGPIAFGYMVQNKGAASMQRCLFELIWEKY